MSSPHRLGFVGRSAALIKSEYGLVITLVVALLIVGLLIGDDFGSSTDEAANVEYAQQALQAYREPGDFDSVQFRKRTGSFYMMIWVLGGDILSNLRSDWLVSDGRHFTNFLFFSLSLVPLYVLCRRFMARGPALIAIALFSTQPLIFGHAFINQKDIPFMVFFLVSVATGLRMADKYLKANADETSEPTLRRAFAETDLPFQLQRIWVASSSRRKATVIAVVGTAIILALELLVFQAVVLPSVHRTLTAAFHGESAEPINRIFKSVAEEVATVPLADYISKVDRIYFRFALFPPVLLALWAMAIAFGREIHIDLASMRRAARQSRGRLTSAGVLLSLIVAAATLGFTASIRPIGPYAGILVSLYFLLALGLSSLIPLLLYWLIGAIFTVASWPALWTSPLSWFGDSLSTNLSFPGGHEVLFAGTTYHSDQLPLLFVPWLMSIQLTLPALLLAVIGLPIAFSAHDQNSRFRIGVLVLTLWIVVPVGAQMTLGIPVYSNFRQLLFVIPPLFIFAGLTVNWLRTARRPLSLLYYFTPLLLIPGLVGIVKLHPFEYVYYNELVGGTAGVEKSYMMDYWCTSYREAIGHLNTIAPAGATIAYWGPRSAALPYASEDINVWDRRSGEELGPDFAIACSWGVNDPDFFSEYEVIYSVRRNGGVFAVVKQPSDK